MTQSSGTLLGNDLTSHVMKIDRKSSEMRTCTHLSLFKEISRPSGGVSRKASRHRLEKKNNDAKREGDSSAHDRTIKKKKKEGGFSARENRTVSYSAREQRPRLVPRRGEANMPKGI